jgi:hypothetical protein
MKELDTEYTPMIAEEQSEDGPWHKNERETTLSRNAFRLCFNVSFIFAIGVLFGICSMLLVFDLRPEVPPPLRNNPQERIWCKFPSQGNTPHSLDQL